MFADYIKMAAKIAAIVAGAALIIVLLSQITMPAFDVTLLTSAIGKGKAILDYYLGSASGLFYLGVGLLTIRFVFIPTLRLSLLALRVILKTND